MQATMMSFIFFLWSVVCPVATLSEVQVGSDSSRSPAWPLKVKLKKVFANVYRVANDTDPMGTPPSFYVGRLSMGEGPVVQDMLVSFDTSSGNVLLFDSTCPDLPCRTHRQYNKKQSTTAIEINTTGHPIAIGWWDSVRRWMWSVISGTEIPRERVLVGISSMELGDGTLLSSTVQESVCVGSGGAQTGHGRRACTELGVLVAQSVHRDPFLAFPHDGIVGLGLTDNLSVGPFFNFVEQFLSKDRLGGAQPHFGLFYGTRGGELTLGGYDASRLASPLQWVPIAPADEGAQYWQVRIVDFQIGGVSMGSCNATKCLGIIETSASSIGISPSIASDVEEFRRCGGPTLSFTLENGMRVSMNPADYITDDSMCDFKVGTLDLAGFHSHLIVLGEPFLRKYYTVFDRVEMRVGVGLAANETADDTIFEDEVDLSVAPHTVSAEAFLAVSAGRSPGTVDVDIESEDGFSDEGLWSFMEKKWHLAAMILFSCIHMVRNELCKNVKGKSVPRPIHCEPPVGDECPICLGCCEEPDFANCACCLQWCTLGCGHKFHENCVLKWIEQSGKCPICRTDVGSSTANAESGEC